MDVSGLIKYKDKVGTVYVLRPITSKDNIEGLTDDLNKKLDKTVHDNAVNDLSSRISSKADASALDKKLDKTVYDSKVTELSESIAEKVDSAYVDNAIAGIDSGILKAIGTSADGVAYSGIIEGVTELVANMAIIFTPSVTSTSKAPTFNLNNLGAKNVRRRLSGLSTMPVSGYSNNWLAANKPYILIYDGDNWVIVGQDQPMADDMYGKLSVGKIYATTDNNGQFLRVVDGVPVWTTIANAEGGSF